MEDKEFLAMRGIQRYVGMLDDPLARRRVLNWVVDKIGNENPVAAQQTMGQSIPDQRHVLGGSVDVFREGEPIQR